MKICTTNLSIAIYTHKKLKLRNKKILNYECRDCPKKTSRSSMEEVP